MKLNEDYLAELEEAAKGRYTEEDEEFMKVFSSPPPKPPILPAEQFNRNRHGGRFRGNRHRGGFRGNWQDRRSDGWQDRSGGHGHGDYRDRRQDHRNYDRRDWRGGGRDSRDHY